MNATEINALEWAVAELKDAYEGTDYYASLVELVWDSKERYLEFRCDKKDLFVFMRKYGITIPLKEIDGWRMVLPADQQNGMINALPESRGILRATNGIMCYIERSNGFPYFGHIQHWVADPKEQQDVVQVRKKRPSFVDKFLDLLEA